MSSGPLPRIGVSTPARVHGPEVDVLVKIEAEPQEDALLEDPRRHARMPDRTQEDGVAALSRSIAGSGNTSPVARNCSPPSSSARARIKGLQPGDIAQHGKSLRDDLRTHSVARDHSDLVQNRPPPRSFALSGSC